MGNKFRVGDIVECISSRYINSITKGELLTVISIYDEYVGFDNNNYCYYPHEDFKLYEKAESEKWHPHHDLIIKWLSSKDMVVDVFNISTRAWHKVDEPDWSVTSKYRVYHKDTALEQLELEDIEYQIAKLQAKVNELKTRMEGSK